MENKGEEYYYPGCILVITIIRDPKPVFFVYLLPATVLFIFLMSVFFLQVDNFADRQANLSIVLLTYVTMLG